MKSLERVNIRTNERTYVRTYVLTYIRTGQTLYPLHNFVVRGDNNSHQDQTNKGRKILRNKFSFLKGCDNGKLLLHFFQPIIGLKFDSGNPLFCGM